MIWFIALLFFVEENQFYGWNHWPKTGGELIADGIFCLLMALAYLGERMKRRAA